MKIRLGNKIVVPVPAPDIDLDAEDIEFGGERLTEARATELARDISRRHGRTGGRPSSANAAPPRSRSGSPPT